MIGSTRQDRLKVPYYNKPIKVHIHKQPLNTPSGGILHTIKSGASKLYNRFLGRQQPSEPPSTESVI